MALQTMRPLQQQRWVEQGRGQLNRLLILPTTILLPACLIPPLPSFPRACLQGGIAAMALSAAATYAPKNIRVNCVAPGLTRTPMTARITGENSWWHA
jgi:hypothetical protein